MSLPWRSSRAYALVVGATVSCGLMVTAAQRAVSPQGPLANPIVNATDSTEHDTQSTPAILRLPGNSVVVAAFNNSTLYTGSNNHRTGWSRSTDNGTTWTDSGALPDSAGGDDGYPFFARNNTTGTIYLTTRSFDATSAGGSSVPLFRSTDNGATWLAPVNAAPGFGAGDHLDTPKIAVDNYVGAGQGNVYVAARNFQTVGTQPNGVFFNRSTDGGATFGTGPGLMLSGGGEGPFVAVGSDHAVYVFWWINLNPAVIRFVKSTNQGVSFGPITTAATLTGTGAHGDLGLGGGFRTNSFPYVVTSDFGDIFLVYNDKNGTDKGDIYETDSGDGGANWSTKFRVNNDAPNHDQFMPNITLTPNQSRLMVTWYDRRSDAGNSLIERWGVVAYNGLSPNFRISTGSWPVVIGQDTYVPATYMGDFDQIAASESYFYVPWGDNRRSNPLTPLPLANQPDVRFARIPVAGPPRGDLDRDLQTDRTVYRPSTGGWYSALSSGGATSTEWGVSGDIDVQGDYDGDGKADVAVFRPSTGAWYIVQSSNGAVRIDTWGVNSDIPLAGDVEGDGIDDLIIWRPSTGVWWVKGSSGGTFGFEWGTPGDQPMLADFDGDILKDFVIYRPSTGVWYLNQSNNGTDFIAWGAPGDIPVVGDFDGDLTADATVFRPSTGVWWVKKSTGGTLTTQWGISTDTPVTGDFDGDGTTDFTIWRDSTGTWYSQLSGGGTTFVNWGTTGDKPVGRRPGT